MSKVTDRIANQNIIDLARKDYEVSKKNKIPSEIVSLPTAGKVYPQSHPLSSGKIEMRYMTAYDEDILTNMSYIRENVVLDKLIDNLIVTPGVSIDDIAQADKDALIIQSRILSYGPEYPVKIQDPETGNYLDRIVDLTKIKFLPFDLQSDENGEFDYKLQNGSTIKFSFLLVKHIKNLSNEHTISSMLQNVIKQIDQSRNANDIDEFIRYKFLAIDARQFRKYIEANTPGIDLDVEFEGESGGTFTSKFQLGSDFFWF